MTPLSHLLVATDLSAPSRHAVERAFRIAAEHGARCTVMHSLELDALDSLVALLGEGIPAVKKKLQDDASTALQELITHAGSGKQLSAAGIIVSGHPLDTILEQVRSLQAELLVLGARGESFLRNALLGSTASRLLRRAERQPVLVVKQTAHESYRHVLVAVDFSPASREAILFARRLAPTAELLLLHALDLPFEGKLSFAGVDEVLIRQYVQTEREKSLHRLHEFAADVGLVPADYSVLVRHGNPSHQIISLEQEQDCDLIVLGKHGTHLAEDLLLGSVTKHVLAESQCDVMVFSDHRPAPGSLLAA